MASNSKFAIAVHTIGVLAVAGDRNVTSEMIAASVNTNAVVIRRIIRGLVEKGLIDVKKGAGGGFRLAKRPDEIFLRDIYLTLDQTEIFDVPELDDLHGCPIGRTVRPVLQSVFAKAESAMSDYLATVSLDEVMEMVRERLPKGLCPDE